MTAAILARARAGDERAFRELTEPHLHELQLHCYRMLGSVHDAEDVLQETLLAAWRGLDRFEERASLRSWLYRIATNRCLNARRSARRRRMEVIPGPPFDPPEPTRCAEPVDLEPYPDALLGEVADQAPGPDALYETRETIELAFIAVLHQLRARQRAVLVLRDVLGMPAEEVAEVLGTTPIAVKGALQRARATLNKRFQPGERGAPPLPESEVERELARSFADAFERDDLEGLVKLLSTDAWLTMPPYPHAYQGRPAIARFLSASMAWRGGRAYLLVPVRANRQPAFACYLEEHASEPPVAHPAGIVVLTLAHDSISAITRFMDARLLGYFGLPRTLRVDRR